MQSVELIKDANIISYVLNLIISVAFLSVLYKFIVIRRKDNADAQNITANANKTTLEVSDKLLKEWMTIADDATKKYRNAKDELGEMKLLLRQMIHFLKQNNIPNSGELMATIEAALKD